MTEGQPISGPATRGAIITVAGKKIKLPDDAYIDSLITIVEPLPGVPTYATPIYVISRGKSKVSISAPTGQLVFERISSEEKGIFDFLDKELPPQVIGVRTMGATLVIAGKHVKLPDNALVVRFIDKIEPDPYGTSLITPADLPVYVIVVGDSAAIWVSSANGRITKENVPKGRESTFDFLKRALQ